MSIPKGYTTKERESDRVVASDHVTAQPVRQKQYAQDTVAHQFVRVVGTDAIEVNSTSTVLNLTAHDAQVGDIIRFTSGNLDGHEARVLKAETNSVELGEILSEAPATSDTIQILRHKYPLVNADGSLSTSVTVETGGVFLEDSAHADGDQVIAVASVRQDTLAASTDTDGDYAAIKSNANGEIYTADEEARTSLSSIDGKITAVDTTGKATEAKQDDVITELQQIEADVEAVEASLTAIEADIEANTGLLTTIDADTSSISTDAATIAGDTTSIDGKITACDTGAVTISSSALPTGAATAANQATIISELQTANAKTPVDFLDSGLVDASSTNITTGGLSVVSSLAADCTELEIIEDIGQFMAITDGTDAILSYLPLGGGRVKLSISSGTELKLASLTGSSITSGNIAINFLG